MLSTVPSSSLTASARRSGIAKLRVKTFCTFALEYPGLAVALLILGLSRLSNQLRICGFPCVFHGSQASPKTEQGCEFRTPPPSSRSPQRDHRAQDPLAHPSGSLRFYPIKSKGSRASGSPLSSQRVTRSVRRVRATVGVTSLSNLNGIDHLNYPSPVTNKDRPRNVPWRCQHGPSLHGTLRGPLSPWRFAK